VNTISTPQMIADHARQGSRSTRVAGSAALHKPTVPTTPRLLWVTPRRAADVHAGTHGTAPFATSAKRSTTATAIAVCAPLATEITRSVRKSAQTRTTVQATALLTGFAPAAAAPAATSGKVQTARRAHRSSTRRTTATCVPSATAVFIRTVTRCAAVATTAMGTRALLPATSSRGATARAETSGRVPRATTALRTTTPLRVVEPARQVTTAPRTPSACRAARQQGIATDTRKRPKATCRTAHAAAETCGTVQHATSAPKSTRTATTAARASVASSASLTASSIAQHPQTAPEMQSALPATTILVASACAATLGTARIAACARSTTTKPTTVLRA